MEPINWERDKNGTVACIKRSKSSRFLSRSVAAAITKSLMHDVTTISASFVVDDVVVFSRLAGISVFEEGQAEFYGLYVSSGAAEEVNYCLRRCTWKRTYRSIKEVLKTLSAQTLFFNVERLEPSLRSVVLAADNGPKDEYQVLAEASADNAFIGKQVSYFVSDDKKELLATYNADSSTNPAVEELFNKLKMVFDMLMNNTSVEPLPDSLRVSYSSSLIADVLYFVSSQLPVDEQNEEREVNSSNNTV